MKHYLSIENCEKEIKEILCVPEKNGLVHLGSNVKEIKDMLMNLKVVVDERKNSISQIWT